MYAVAEATTDHWSVCGHGAWLQQQRTWHSAWTWTKRSSCDLLQQIV